MRNVLLAALLCASSFAQADLVMKNDTGTLELRLQDTACSHGETLASLLPEWRPNSETQRS
jgi:hypothetical protein